MQPAQQHKDLFLTAYDHPCASNPCTCTLATLAVSCADRSFAGLAGRDSPFVSEDTNSTNNILQPPPTSLHKKKTLKIHFTVASLQTVHLTTCWCSLPSKLISDWHTRQFITGTPLASGLAIAVYGGGSSAARDEEISVEKPNQGS